MKKILPILMLSFLAAGCYEEILIPTEDKNPVLVMNAQMNTLEKEHTVHLSLSRLSKVEPVPGAEVKVYVNGVATTALEVQEEYPWNRTPYSFEAEFHPGDEVRVEARKDAFFVTSTLIVPPPAAIESLDTSSVRITYMGDTSDYLQLKVRFKDLPDRSWYGVDHYMYDTCEYLDENGEVIPEYVCKDVQMRGGMETDFDPVISEGAGKTAGGEITALVSASNYFHCFSDDPIQDEECTLRVLIYPGYVYLPKYRYATYVPDVMQDEVDWTLLQSMPTRIHRSCRFWLRSLDFTQYHYLKALNNLENFGNEVSFLVEPTTLPSNVEGGLGFVGIETITELEYATFDKAYDPVDMVYY